MPKPAFPILIKIGSVTVRVYRHERLADGRGRSAREFFTVTWHDAGGARRIRQFADLTKAKEEARMKAEALAGGRSEAAASLSMDDVALISEIRRMVGMVGKTPPLAAVEEWVKAKGLCGDNLLVAAQAWADKKRATHSATISEAVTAFLAAKRRAGVSMKSYEAFLPPLAEEMGDAPIAVVSATTLEDWLHERYGDEETETANPSTFNTGRKRCIALWRWARDKGLVPDSVKTQADLIEPMREGSQRIGILTLATYRAVLALVRAEHPEYLAVAVLAGFAGLRRAELHAQTWEDIDLKRKLLRVTVAKKGTAAYRLVHLCPAAVAWLTVAQRQEKDAATGLTPIAPAWAMDRIRTFAREAVPPLVCPENGFRHSFVSYRCAATGNVNETAQEAGNSAAVVFKHYRELVAKEEGKAWFAIAPPPTPQAPLP
jgi:integrase